MDFKKLAEMAQKQRALEETEELETEPSTAESADGDIDDAFYIPVDDDDELVQFADDGYSNNSTEETSENTESLESIIERCFSDERAYNIELDRLIPFREFAFSSNEDISELKSSITRVGITEPLLVRSASNGEYEILSGNARKKAAEILLWSKVPCRIADNDKLTDEYARRIVVESNRHRFSTLKLSDKIRAAAILDNATEDLQITAEQARQYKLLNNLEQRFLEMIDSGELSAVIAEKLTVFDKEQQKTILNALNENGELKITKANVDELCNAKRLTGDSIVKILKPKPPIKIAISAEIIAEYMRDKSAEEVSDIVVKAICKYFE